MTARVDSRIWGRFILCGRPAKKLFSTESAIDLNAEPFGNP